MKIIMIFCLLFLTFNNSYGQWYVKKYQVSDIKLLSKEQLDESLLDSKKALLASGIIAGMGGAMILISKYSHWAPEENPTLLQQLMGQKWKNTSATIIGGGLLIGGTIAAIVYIGRIDKIRSVIKKNYPSVGSFYISPKIISDRYIESYHWGVSLTLNF